MNVDGKILKDIGEEGVIAIIREIGEITGARLHPDLGFDDTAIVARDFFQAPTVWTSDSQVEGTHFRFYPALAGLSLEWLGRRLFRVNLSDLSSKGAKPALAILSLGLPTHASANRIREFLDGFLQEMAHHGVTLAGGDTHRSPVWSVSLTLVGELASEPPRRTSIKAGQNLYITGNPGISASGYQWLNTVGQTANPSFRNPSDLPESARTHLVPPDRSVAGRDLVSAIPDLAMMDCSDGILKDCGRLSKAGKVGIDLQLSTELLKGLSEKLQTSNPAPLFLTGGEDYELLFATEKGIDEIQSILKTAEIDLTVSRIGKVTSGQSVRVFIEGDNPSDDCADTFLNNEFDHFS